MASSGKKVVPIFLAVLIAVGAALYMGMLSYRPEVIDEPPPDPPASVTARTSGTSASDAPTSKTPPASGPSAPAKAAESEERGPADVDDAAGDAPEPAKPPTGKPTTDTADDDEAAPAPPAPTAPPEAPTGMLDKQTIMDGIAAVKPTIKACFEEGLKRDPSLAGRVVIHFEIEAEEGEGRITRGEVKEAETQSLFFEACVLKEVSKATFDAPRGGGKVVVNYPFNFDPGGGWGGEVPPDDAAEDDE